MLRAEKGYIIVGQDTDGTLTPDDAGLGWAIGKTKPDFVGKRSLTRPDMVAKGRKQLVGLLTDDPKVVLQEGAQIVADPNQPKPMTMLGHVTSSYWSEALGRSIAMAVVDRWPRPRGRNGAHADAGRHSHAATVDRAPCSSIPKTSVSAHRRPVMLHVIQRRRSTKPRSTRRPGSIFAPPRTPRGSACASTRPRPPRRRPHSARHCPPASARRATSGGGSALQLGPDEWLL